MRSRSISKAPPVVDVHGAFLRRTDLSGASLRHANLSKADLSHAILRDADFLGARMAGTILRGADLTHARNLTAGQLAGAIVDERTRLPADIDPTPLLNPVTKPEVVSNS